MGSRLTRYLLDKLLFAKYLAAANQQDHPAAVDAGCIDKVVAAASCSSYGGKTFLTYPLYGIGRSQHA
jgi:hypothetical protein